MEISKLKHESKQLRAKLKKQKGASNFILKTKKLEINQEKIKELEKKLYKNELNRKNRGKQIEKLANRDRRPER